MQATSFKLNSKLEGAYIPVRPTSRERSPPMDLTPADQDNFWREKKNFLQQKSPKYLKTQNNFYTEQIDEVGDTTATNFKMKTTSNFDIKSRNTKQFNNLDRYRSENMQASNGFERR